MSRPLTSPRSGALRYAVVGTAGHIDHGKSALVRALTGVDPDRLEEEKRRGMTIDLGFAHFDLPSGLRVGLVDVPGHERLIKNMLAGAAGVDLVLLVVASDEGVMPQTREHLDILRFLQVHSGIVVLTKADLATDPEWVALVREEITALCGGTFLEGAPIVPVSSRTGAGIPDLVAAMDRALTEIPARDADAPARLPVDRSFTMPGFGTVVTGTLWTGRIRTGDPLELLPPGRAVRVRQVQSHGVVVEEAHAGQRVALNIPGIAKDEIVRGYVLATPGTFRPSRVLDVRLRLLPAAPPLAHHARIRLYVGADEVIGRVRLLDRDRLEPRDEAVAQLRLDRPIVTARGDPFVLRRYSPMATVGGGEIIATGGTIRKRGAETAERLSLQAASGFDTQVLDALRSAGAHGTTVEAIVQETGATRDRVAAQMQVLVGSQQALQIRGRLFAGQTADRISADILRTLAAYHTAVPWRLGMPRDELKSRVFAAGDDRLYGHVLDALAAGGQIAIQGEFVRGHDFVPVRTEQDEAAARAIVDSFRRGRFAPPGRDEVLAHVGDRAAADRMMQALLDEGALVDVGGDVIFHGDALAEIQGRVVSHITEHGDITVAALRDQLGSSRKFTLTVLEFFDARHLTRRAGDKRVLVRPPARP
jgi:selenocysteine-specific elongation factor